MRRLVKSGALSVALVLIILIASVNIKMSFAQPSNSFTITGAPSSVAAGQSFNGVTVTVYNSNGQVWTSFTGQVYFTSTDPEATLPYTASSPYTFTTGPGADDGVHTFSGFNLITAGSQTITVKSSSLTPATTSPITVTPSTPVSIQISPVTATIGAGSSETYTATATDIYGNTWAVSSSSSWYAIGSGGLGGSWSGSTLTISKAGGWTIEALYEGLPAFASLTVTTGPAMSITISPKTPSITAGNTQTFTASAQDAYGNSWDVTSSTTWSIDSGAGSSWSGNTYTSDKAGTWIVTGTYQGYSDTASLTVTHSTPFSISISPTNPTFQAGSSVTFTATAYDYYGNSWDVTNSATWSITSGAGGSWDGNVYTCAKAGIWTVTANYDGMPGTTTLTVSYASVFSVSISPSTASIQAGTTQAFTATASDMYGNTWDVTSSATWTISNGAEGSWSGNVYTGEIAGTWTVTGTYEGLFGTATITVTPGSPVGIVVGSTSSSITAGTSATFTATAYDNYGNSWDVSSSTVWIIDSGAEGSWSTNVYTSQKAGTWVVTGVYDDLRDQASLTVTPGAPSSITISPTSSSLEAGLSETYTATATDSYANTWDVSASATWSISTGAGGSWSNNVYTSAMPGTWTVTATYQGLQETSSLTVTHSYAVSIQVSLSASPIVAGSTDTFTATAFDHYGNSWYATSSATFTIDEAAGGSLTGNLYTSETAGTWTVTATAYSLTNTASLTVTHASPIAISVSPGSATVTAGATQAYTATASDTYGNIWDVSAETTWTISSDAGGSWTSNVYTSAVAGSWEVTGTYQGLSDYGYLTVNHAPAIRLTISPSSATITTGSTEAYTATATDSYGNSWDATSSTLWQIGAGAGGSWSGNVYTSLNAGTWQISGYITGLNNQVISATASLTVNHGAAVSIVVTPSSASIIAGQYETFTATAYDSNGNPFVVSTLTTWTIDAGAAGTWAGSTYTSNTAGTWIVTGTYEGLTSTATLAVTHAPAASITIGTSSNPVIAGSTATFTATASDVYGNLWDVTASTVWSIDPGAAGSWSGNTYTSQLAGVWSVKGTYGSLSDSIYLMVNHASMVSISVTPAGATVAAGSNEVYSVTAYDTFGNSWDVTSSAQLSVSSGAGGTWSSNTYTPAIAGAWIITAVVPGFSATTSINVVHGTIASITISPKTPTITAGSTLTFTATAYDAYGNQWDVSNQAIWIIDSGAQGSWTNSVYTSAKAGTWEVTGDYDNLMDNTFLTVNHGTITGITISPASASINAESTQSYTATASDAYGNTWDTTSTTSWQISAGAGGQWTGNTYTSANSGSWIVTGTSGGVSGTATLTVNAYLPDDFLHNDHVNYLDELYFIIAYNNYGEFGIVNPACDFNHDGVINFEDVVIFVTYYIAEASPNPYVY